MGHRPGRRSLTRRCSGLASLAAELQSLGSAGEARGRIQVMTELTRITRDPSVMGGKPCIRGMRVTVGTLVGLIAAGHIERDILEMYPYLEAADIREALSYAAWRAEEVEVPLANV